MKTTNAANTASEILEPTDASGDLLPLESLLRNAVIRRRSALPSLIATAPAILQSGILFHARVQPEELRYKSIASLTLVDDLEPTVAGLEQLWLGDISHLDVEKRYVRKDGSELWVRVTTSLVRDGGGSPECSVEFLRDISARTKMAAALLQNRTLLAAVIAELPLALLACDVNGRVTHYNRAAIKLFGCLCRRSRPSGRRQALSDDIPGLSGRTAPRRCRARIVLWRARCAGEEVSDVELVIVRPDGQARTTLSSARRLHRSRRSALGRVAVVQDITERRHAEQELEGSAQAAARGLPPGRHGRGGDQRAAQRRQCAQQRECLREPGRGASQANPSAPGSAKVAALLPRACERPAGILASAPRASTCPPTCRAGRRIC